MSAVFQVERLTRTFGKVIALAGLSLEVGEGELYGLVGADGAGKTTTIRSLAGLLDPEGGRVRVLGLDPISQGARVREHLGLMPQQYSLYRDLTVIENLRFFGRLYCLPAAVFAERSQRLLHLTRLEPFVDRRADALSGGMYKKLALACALLHQPKALMLDEPTNGVDPVSRRELWDLLHEFVHGGMAVLLSTPYMDEAERCHRVGLIHHGELLVEGEPQRLLRDFDHETLEVLGGDRAAVLALLEQRPEVRASSPVGNSLKVVVAPGKRAVLEAALQPLGARLAPATPNFEDLFLARVEAHRGDHRGGDPAERVRA